MRRRHAVFQMLPTGDPTRLSNIDRRELSAAYPQAQKRECVWFTSDLLRANSQAFFLTWAMLLIGFAGIGVAAYRRKWSPPGRLSIITVQTLLPPCPQRNYSRYHYRLLSDSTIRQWWCTPSKYVPSSIETRSRRQPMLRHCSMSEYWPRECHLLSPSRQRRIARKIPLRQNSMFEGRHSRRKFRFGAMRLWRLTR
jgi:hypothetical protein